MRVLLLGATGRTGHLILEELIARRHSIVVVVRDRDKIRISSSKMLVFEGSTLDERLMASAFIGCDAVISALNVSRNSDFPWSALRTPKSLMSDTIKLVISIAKSHRLNRIIVLSAWGAHETINDIPWWFRWTIKFSNIKYGYWDHERQEDLLLESGMNWTAIRPVGLINSKAHKQVKVVINGKTKPSLIINRQSVALFTADVLEKDMYVKMTPAISWD
jgi:putative NADH-flavin reductase